MTNEQKVLAQILDACDRHKARLQKVISSIDPAIIAEGSPVDVQLWSEINLLYGWFCGVTESHDKVMEMLRGHTPYQSKAYKATGEMVPETLGGGTPG